jgi:hypothetical protein
MKLNDLYSAQCALAQAKAKAFQIYLAIINEEKEHKLSRDQNFAWGRTNYNRKWGEHLFHENTDLDCMTIEIEQYGFEQTVTRTEIKLTIVVERYCRGEYHEEDWLTIPDWLFDDPSERNIKRFIAETVAELEKNAEAHRQKEAKLRADHAAQARIKRKERFESLKRVFENEEMIEERLEYDRLKREFEPEEIEEES